MNHSIERVVLVKPRGFCAGVKRAVETVKKALAIFGTPVYIKHQIVHNKTVVEDLEKQGAITIENLNDVPVGSVVIFSAHGSTPEEYNQAKKRGLKVIDATCPLVTKVHKQVHKFIEKDFDLVYIGKKDHVESIGVIAEGLEFGKEIPVVEKIEDIDFLEINSEKIAYLTQTTLSVLESQKIIKKLEEKFPGIVTSPSKDICYATTNRQGAVLQLAEISDLVFVVGSKNSSNSKRLADSVANYGKEVYLINGLEDMKLEWLEGKKVLGISAGASAPEYKVAQIVKFFEKGWVRVNELEVVKEKVGFKMPKELV